jgi:hypothetical protein
MKHIQYILERKKKEKEEKEERERNKLKTYLMYRIMHTLKTVLPTAVLLFFSQ